MEDPEQRRTCRNCKREIVGMGYHLRPIGTADEMLGNLELDAELSRSETLAAEVGATLAEGWDSCIPCMTVHAMGSLTPEGRLRIADLLVRMIDDDSSGQGTDTAD